MDDRAQKAEIDLLDIAVATVQALIKNLTWVILITAGCGIGGYLMSKFSSAYESQIMIKARKVKDKELGFLLYNYQQRGVPGIRKRDAEKIKSFSFIVHSDTRPSLPGEAKEHTESFATLTVKTTDSTLFSKIQTEIIDAMNHEKVVMNYFASDHAANAAIISEYKNKIRQAESLAARQANPDAIALFPEIMSMTTRLAELEARYELPMVETVDDFAPISTKLNPLKATAAGIVVGMILSAFFIGIRSFVSYYRTVTARI